jgi:hypothetical protein
MTSPPSPPEHRRRRIVVTIVVVAVGLCWWMWSVRDWLDSLQLMVIGVAAYGLCRYLVVATKGLTRPLHCEKCGGDALDATCSGAWVPKFGVVTFYLCRSCNTRWAYNPFTNTWFDACEAENDRRFSASKR